jgi:hypothetical protein
VEPSAGAAPEAAGAPAFPGQGFLPVPVSPSAAPASPVTAGPRSGVRETLPALSAISHAAPEMARPALQLAVVETALPSRATPRLQWLEPAASIAGACGLTFETRRAALPPAGQVFTGVQAATQAPGRITAALAPLTVAASPVAASEFTVAAAGPKQAGFLLDALAPTDIPARPSGVHTFAPAASQLRLPKMDRRVSRTGTPSAVGPILRAQSPPAPVSRPALAQFTWASLAGPASLPTVVSTAGGLVSLPRAGASPLTAKPAAVGASAPRLQPLAGVPEAKASLPGVEGGPHASMVQPYSAPHLDLVLRERRASPSWSPQWMVRVGDICLGDFAVGSSAVSLPKLLAHACQTPEPIPINRVLQRRVRQDSWRSSRLPRDLQAIAASIILGAVLWAGWSVSHPAGSGGEAITTQNRTFARSSGPLAWVRQAIANRASVELTERFGAGEDVWKARDTVKAAAWTFSPARTAKAPRVALYNPSLTLTDYYMEFLAQIEKRSAGWVVRARDVQNYYALDLRVTKPGPRPMLSLTRYTVVGGKPGRKVEVPVPMRLQNNMPYRIAMAVKGRRFAASIEGQEVDSWSDDVLPTGGVGFLSEAGSQAKVYWVKVTNNDDLIGRICGSIASTFSSGDRASLGYPSYQAGWQGAGFFFAAAGTPAVMDLRDPAFESYTPAPVGRISISPPESGEPLPAPVGPLAAAGGRRQDSREPEFILAAAPSVAAIFRRPRLAIPGSLFAGPARASAGQPRQTLPHPEVQFAAATVMETPGRERSMTHGLPGPGNRRG